MSKQITQLTICMLGAVVMYDEVLIFKKQRLLNQMAHALSEAQAVMKADDETTQYLLALLNKHKPEIDEFDMIALSNLGINFGPPEPR